ncbi:MAG: pentapeptide repeat-containing protein, partial [Cyanobacteria bacterium P01_H01_bin.15]
MLHLEPFTEDQIREVLGKRTTSDDSIEKILGNEQLRELARRPLMSELILEALPEIEQGKPIDISRIYLYAVTEKMNRDIKAERTFTSLADKLYFLCEVSYEMLDRDNMSLNYLEFPERLRRLFGPVVQKEKELDHWRYDMMGQAMLIRDDDGNYKPAHRSLLEFFVAYKLAASLGVLAEDFLAVAQQQECVAHSLPAQAYRWSEYFTCEMAGEERKQIAPLQEFVREEWGKLRQEFGDKPWTKAVLDLMLPMVRRDDESIRRLQQVLIDTKGMATSLAGRLGGNTATLLTQVNSIGLQNLDLENSILIGADLKQAWLLGTKLTNANLTDALFLKPNLSAVNSVVFAPDGKTFATGHSNGNIWIWRTEDGQALELFRGHQNTVRSVAYSPDGRQLASGSYDKTIRLWEVGSGECQQVPQGHQNWVNSVAYSPDGRQLASGSSDNTIRLWEVGSGECQQVLQGHQGSVLSVAYSPDGRQ